MYVQYTSNAFENLHCIVKNRININLIAFDTHNYMYFIYILCEIESKRCVLPTTAHYYQA